MVATHRFACLGLCLLLAGCALQPDGFGFRRASADVRTSGRAQRTADGWQVTWPAVAWRTAFSGTSIGIDTEDRAGYHVEIDGQALAPLPATPSRLTIWYRGLAPGAHLIEVIRKAQTPRAPGHFYGFALEAAGRWLPMHPAPVRQVLLLGDSIATGYGDLSTSVDCPVDVRPFTERARATGSWPRGCCMRTGRSMRWMESVWCETGMAYGRAPTTAPTRRARCNQIGIALLGSSLASAGCGRGARI